MKVCQYPYLLSTKTGLLKSTIQITLTVKENTKLFELSRAKFDNEIKRGKLYNGSSSKEVRVSKELNLSRFYCVSLTLLCPKINFIQNLLTSRHSLHENFVL